MLCPCGSPGGLVSQGSAALFLGAVAPRTNPTCHPVNPSRLIPAEPGEQGSALPWLRTRRCPPTSAGA